MCRWLSSRYHVHPAATPQSRFVAPKAGAYTMVEGIDPTARTIQKHGQNMGVSEQMGYTPTLPFEQRQLKYKPVDVGDKIIPQHPRAIYATCSTSLGSLVLPGVTPGMPRNAADMKTPLSLSTAERCCRVLLQDLRLQEVWVFGLTCHDN
eukprot:s3938_g3.t2